MFSVILDVQEYSICPINAIPKLYEVLIAVVGPGFMSEISYLICVTNPC